MERASTLAWIASLILVAAPAQAGSPEPEELIEAFMESLVAGKVSEGFDALMKHSRIDETKPREIGLAKSRIVESFQVYQPPIGYEEVRVARMSPSLEKLTFLTKHPDMVLVWNFYFYRASDRWNLLNFDFNDKVQRLE